MEDLKTRFREIYYSSLLQQRQENETNRIKIVLISVGATVAGIIGTIKGIQSLPSPFLILVILIAGYVPWVRVLYVLFKKLEVDVKVIDEKIDRIGTKLENEAPASKEIADKFNEKFHKSLICLFIGITCILTYILITAFIAGGKEMSKKEKTKEVVINTVVDSESTINTVVDRERTHEQSYGGRLPGFFQPDQDKPNPAPDQEQVTSPQATVTENPVENPTQDTGQEAKPEPKQ